MSRPDFAPFADDAAVETLGDLTIENGTRHVALHGSLEITRDLSGLALARALKSTVDAIVAALEAAPLPAEAASVDEPARHVRNPFA